MPDDQALRPPEKWAHLRWHWLTTGFDHFAVFEWRQEHWRFFDSSFAYLPREIAAHGWGYHGPCVPAARTPDPNDAEMVECVARAIDGAHTCRTCGAYCEDGSPPNDCNDRCSLDSPTSEHRARAALTALAKGAEKPPAE